jgi:leucyl aminopeptidase
VSVRSDYRLITAVGQAARVSPRIVALEYRGAADLPDSDTLLLVGKGITFDSGGLNLKTAGMEDMHMDMSGAAAVLAAIKALAALKANVNAVAIMALAENAIGPNAYKPHAIIQTEIGTVEVSNTDAEGRLALADAFLFARKQWPRAMRTIDIATLTGACRNALGERTIGAFGDTSLVSGLSAAATVAAEQLWHLPIFPVPPPLCTTQEDDGS